MIRPNVAIPHTTIPGVDGVRASVGIQRSTEAAEKAHFWLLFVSGSDSIREHLEFLRSVAQTLSEDLLDQLSATNTKEEAFRLLTHAELT